MCGAVMAQQTAIETSVLPDVEAPSGAVADAVAVSDVVPDVSPTVGAPEIMSPIVGALEIMSPDNGAPEIMSPDVGSPDVVSLPETTPLNVPQIIPQTDGWAMRPFARADFEQARRDAVHARLAAFRPHPRPPYMVRYPVVLETRTPTIRPNRRDDYLPRTRWEHKAGSDLWTRAALSALMTHGAAIEDVIPRDIDTWCPAYAQNSPELRRAFWVGMMSALSKHESTYNPRAVGGPNLWYGLLQIYPDTARRYGCFARTGEALKNPTDNLSCAVRIMAVTIPRDRAVALHDGRWRGVAADWGPMVSAAKRREMSAWTRAQNYCVPQDEMRPRARP